MKKTILILSAILLFIGCGSDDEEKKNIDVNKTEESNVTTPKDENNISSVDYTIPLKYEYNKDGSSTRRLAPLYVNKHKEVQKKLDESKSDSVEFYSVLSGYIGDLYRGTESLTTLPAYAPSGESKSQMLTVANGQVDYSSYKLKGDVDFNWEVDFTDLKLLSKAILNDVDSFQYDVNGDGKVDTADVIDVVSRFGNEIGYFDFYTTDGTKLSIDTRTTDEEKSFTYGSSETQIMVVAKDRNHASAYESGLSDIGDVWYKKDGWVLQNKVTSINKLSKLNKTTITGWEFLGLNNEIESYPYLTGMSYKITYYSAEHPLFEEVFKVPLTDKKIWDVFINARETKMKSYFSTTNMNYPFKKTVHNSEEYSSEIGLLKGNKIGKIGEVTIISNYHREEANGFSTDFILIKHRYMTSAQTFYSPKSYMLVGELQRDDQKEAKGTVTVGRIGPDQEDVLTGDIEDSIFSVEDASFGTYTIDYLDGCSCSNNLGEYVFEAEGETPVYTLKSTKVKTKLQLLDKEKEPIDEKTIKIVAKACVNSDDDEKSFSSVTDASGYVEFSDVPIGDYTVYVDGKENSELHFCEAYDGKLTGEKLWDIDFKFISKRNADAPSSAMKDSSGEWHWKKIKISNITNSMNSIETATTLIDNGEYPYPIRFSNEGATLILLTNTTFFDKAENGLALHYIESSPIMSKRYCINIDEGLIDNHMQELYPSYHPDAIAYLGRLIFTTSCGANTALDTSWMIDASLHSAEINSLKEYREFTVKSTGTWTDDRGKTTMTVKFTPSK